VDVYIVRHAIAGHADSSRWPDDADRPLTPEGAESFRSAAAGLRRIVPNVDVVLSSGFVRAWQTAELLHEVAGWPVPEASRELEVGRTPSETVAVLQRRSEQSIALVGHEPHLSRLTSLLCTGMEDGLRLTLKKGAVVHLRSDGAVGPGAASLRWTTTPKILRALAPDSG
jgi:phosphohistidine phosphatase